MTDRVTITMLDGGIADVRLVRADKMNALDPAMFAALVAAIDELNAMPGLRCVVLSGEGRSFCAGLDMASMAAGGITGGNDADLAPRSHGLCNVPQYVAWGWRELPVPVIAAGHGVIFGGGLQIFSGADIRIIAPDARLAVMEMKWGLVPDMAGFPLWRGNVRDDLLRELIYTNREFSGTQAVDYGFATSISAEPLAAALDLAHTIAAKHPAAVRGAKRLMASAATASDAELLLAETAEQLAIIRTPDQIEAVMAAMAGRAPVFADGRG